MSGLLYHQKRWDKVIAIWINKLPNSIFWKMKINKNFMNLNMHLSNFQGLDTEILGTIFQRLVTYQSSWRSLPRTDTSITVPPSFFSRVNKILDLFLEARTPFFQSSRFNTCVCSLEDSFSKKFGGDLDGNTNWKDSSTMFLGVLVGHFTNTSLDASVLKNHGNLKMRADV